MLNLSPKELKAIARIMGIKDYKSMSEDRLLNGLKASESLKESEKDFDHKKLKINFSKPRIGKIRKKFNELKYKFSKSKITEIRRNLSGIENEKNHFAPKMKEIKENLLELEKNPFEPKKYYDYDDTEYKGIRNVKDFCDLSVDEDYYKPIITNSTFNNNYIQSESKGNKDKILTTNEYLDMIRPYLSDHKNHKMIIKLKVNGEFIQYCLIIKLRENGKFI